MRLVPSKDAQATDDLKEALTPQQPITTDVVNMHDSTGIDTLEKKNIYKRAAKGALTPPVLKKIKVSQDMVHKYDKFVIHGRKFKRKKKNEQPKKFVKIGWFFCSYKSFHGALQPHQYMSNEVMGVWVKKFNHAAKSCADKRTCVQKKYAFSPYMVEKLDVEPSIFNSADVMEEFKIACSKFKILEDNYFFFPIVQSHQWIVCCINFISRQFHVFDSMMPDSGVSTLTKAANNLFSNFIRTANKSKLSSIDFAKFKNTTPDHPQQTTLFDSGFYSILFMEYFNGKVMPKFDNEAILDF